MHFYFILLGVGLISLRESSKFKDKNKCWVVTRQKEEAL